MNNTTSNAKINKWSVYDASVSHLPFRQPQFRRLNYVKLSATTHLCDLQMTTVIADTRHYLNNEVSK